MPSESVFQLFFFGGGQVLPSKLTLKSWFFRYWAGRREIESYNTAPCGNEVGLTMAILLARSTAAEIRKLWKN